MISFGDDENVLKLILVMEAQFFEYTKIHLIGHLKWVHFTCISIKLLTKIVKKTKNKNCKEEIPSDVTG